METKVKIQIKSVFGKVLFEYEKENNTIKDTLVEAVNGGADLRGADLYGADLRGADLRGADLRERHLDTLPETDDRTDAQVAGQIAAERSTAERIVADILAGRVVSQRDSDYYKTTAFHSRIADARRILFARGFVLRSRFTTDAETPAGRPFKIYWIDNPNTETK